MSPSAKFPSYLAGLALAMIPAGPALASSAPPAPSAARAKVAYHEELAQKLVATAQAEMGNTAVWEQTNPFSQGPYFPFERLFVEYSPFIQVQPHETGAAAPALRPSEAFALVKNR